MQRHLDRRQFLKAAAMSAGGLALAGCGGGAPGGAGPRPIRYWHHFTNPTEMRGLERVVERFAAAYPEVQVVPANIPNQDFMARVTAAVQARSVPDAAMVTGERLGTLVAMDGLVDLTHRVAGWAQRRHFPEDRWRGVSAGGRIYGVPAFAFVDWVYYRRDWFEEAGIEPPATLDDFLDAAIRLTDAEHGRYGFGLRGGDGGQFAVIDMMEAFGSPIAVNGKAAIDTQRAAEGLRFYAELYSVHKVVPGSAPTDGYRQVMEAFRTGQTAMLWHGTGSLTEVQRSLTDRQFMTARKPAGPAGIVSRLSYLYNGLMDEEQADAAWAWVTFWGQAAPAIDFLETTGYFPASAVVAADPRVTGNPFFAAAIESVKFGRPPHQFAGADAWGRNTVLPAFQRILSGERTPEQAAEEIAQGLVHTLS